MNCMIMQSLHHAQETRNEGGALGVVAFGKTIKIQNDFNIYPLHSSMNEL